ncbi:sensor histidine kinase [Bacillus sp. B1-b2]|uniref:sensor histidine kinase n=1 Tax=Bacillus sp. B1-b2 TaxID=2653201 RepID=UPI001261764B|nr:HAMP domain-containing sensor histidine kinase [Bacillus sp. B1-b2]KAB7671119.1 HAMP domain-containing histidine kinase [Bacillus sp. B1-b2]
MEKSTLDKEMLTTEAFEQLKQAFEIRMKDQAALLKSMEETLEDLTFHTTYSNNINKMVSSITHEVRNPLTTVKGFLQLMKQSIKEQTLASYIDISLNEISRASDLLTEFLACSKNHKQVIESYAINDTIMEISPIIMAKANFSDVQVHTTLTNETLFTIGEKNKLKQVLLNIITNALESYDEITSYSNRVIDIKTELNQETIVISIKDNGIGMKEKQLEQLFQPLQTSKKEGNGMGLFLCKKLIERANGDIVVESTRNVGTTVKLLLPFIKN